MYEKWKKAGIFLGHVICIFIVVYCFIGNKQANAAPGKNSTLPPTVMPTVAVKPILTETVPPTEIPTLAVTAIPTEAPTPTITLIPTEVPTPTITVIPTEAPTPTVTATPIVTVTPEPTVTVTMLPTTEKVDARTIVKENVLQNIENGVYSSIENEKSSWWFVRKENKVPSGSGEAFPILEYQGFYRNDKVTQEDKVLYLTIDCGYESENTPIILDILKKHDVKVTFFVTNYFMKDSPKEVVRMVEEGHTVANHSVSHANLTKLTEEEIYKEIVGCEELFYELTGREMAPYFRPPGGAYSRRTMQITEDLGYKTIFWSIAYRDYDINNQPGKQYVLDHFATYHHNGAIPLMHNDSVSNAEAMDELLIYLKEQGYRFGTLDELK